MFRVKIYGAGSIGNHLANASRTLGWSVTVADVSDAALQRMKTDIYPARYGKWDDSIRLFTNAAAPKGEFDLIIIGTPPEHHIPLALEALKENPAAILIEKPLCSPHLDDAEKLASLARAGKTKVFVGYTHTVGKSMAKTEELIASGVIGDPKTLDVEFREHWEGIFKAHPWLNGPEDSYLGYWAKGGGASGEHSHAINLWQHLAHVLGKGRVKDVLGTLTYVRQGRAEYDDLCLLNLTTEKGFTGRVVQDVVTKPSRKWAKIQGTEGAIEWWANYDAQGDAVAIQRPGKAAEFISIPKKRPDDFIDELKILHADLIGGKPSALALERGLDTMLVLAAAHVSQAKGAKVTIDYSKGYVPAAVGAAARQAELAGR